MLPSGTTQPQLPPTLIGVHPKIRRPRSQAAVPRRPRPLPTSGSPATVPLLGRRLLCSPRPACAREAASARCWALRRSGRSSGCLARAAHSRSDRSAVRHAPPRHTPAALEGLDHGGLGRAGPGWVEPGHCADPARPGKLDPPSVPFPAATAAGASQRLQRRSEGLDGFGAEAGHEHQTAYARDSKNSNGRPTLPPPRISSIGTLNRWRCHPHELPCPGRRLRRPPARPSGP